MGDDGLSMSEATALILKQGGIFGALLVIAGFVIWKLWSDASDLAKKNTDALVASNTALTAALAASNAERLADHVAMTAQLLKMATDTVSGLTNASNAVEASTAVAVDGKLAIRDVASVLREATEELRRSRERTNQ